MKLLFKLVGEANSIEETIKKIILIKNNYKEYLFAAKKNSQTLLELFKNDPLKINIK